VTDGYPRSLSALASWSQNNKVTLLEARHRFAQYAALCGIASVAPLRQSLVFKGGNALDFVWQPNRSTLDLDFSLDMVSPAFRADRDTIKDLLDQAFRVVRSRIGVVLVINSVRQQPPGEGRTFITFAARAGYALTDETRLITRMANGETSPHMLPIEISLNEPICESTWFRIDNGYEKLRISTLEDIVGEKLRALLCCNSQFGIAIGDKMCSI
jgi:hypothetical protein